MNQDKNHVSNPKTKDSEEGHQEASTNAGVGGCDEGGGVVLQNGG
jgi:hypothetical protein